MIIKHYFNQYSTATLAAIEYVIKKYGHNEWFNGVLRKLMLNLHVMTNNKTFKKPLIFFYKNKLVIGYEGYHYLIFQMEKYSKLYNMNLHWFKFLVWLNVFLISGLLVYYFIHLNKKKYTETSIMYTPFT